MAAGKGVKITPEQIAETIQNLVLKRDVLEGEDAVKAKRRMAAVNKPKKAACTAAAKTPPGKEAAANDNCGPS
jgi:nucleoside diphosphate kinase